MPSHDLLATSKNLSDVRCIKSVQIRSFFWYVFSHVWTEYRKIRTKKTPYLDTFHTVVIHKTSKPFSRALNAFAVTLHLFYAAPPNVQEPPFKFVLHKTVLRNFTKFAANHHYRTHLLDPLFSQSCKL